jgi:hypothetical protein
VFTSYPDPDQLLGSQEPEQELEGEDKAEGYGKYDGRVAGETFQSFK